MYEYIFCRRTKLNLLFLLTATVCIMKTFPSLSIEIYFILFITRGISLCGYAVSI